MAGIFDKCQKKDGKLVNRHAVTDMEFSNPADLKKMGEIGVTGEIYFQIMSLDPADDVKNRLKRRSEQSEASISGIEEVCLMEE